MGRCSGNALFGCDFQSSQQNFVCPKCENRFIPLERCRFSEHFMFEGEDGNFLCRRPKIQMKKFPYVYGYYHLIVFSNQREAEMGTDLVNARSRPKRFGLLSPAQVLPKRVWPTGIPLTLKKQLHRLVPIGISRNDPDFIDPCPENDDQKENRMKYCPKCRQGFLDDNSSSSSNMPMTLPPRHQSSSSSSSSQRQQSMKDNKSPSKQRLCVGVRIETPRNYDMSDADISASPSPNPSPLTPTLSSVSIKVLGTDNSDPYRPNHFTFDQPQPDRRRFFKDVRGDFRDMSQHNLIDRVNRLTVNQTPSSALNKQLQMESKELSPLSATESDISSKSLVESPAGGLRAAVQNSQSCMNDSVPVPSPANTKPCLDEIQIPPGRGTSSASSSQTYDMGPRGTGPLPASMGDVGRFRSPDLGVIKPPDLVIPDSSAPQMDTTMIRFTMDLPEGQGYPIVDQVAGEDGQPPFWVDVTSNQHLRQFNAAYDPVAAANMTPEQAYNNFQSVFEASFATKRDLTPTMPVAKRGKFMPHPNQGQQSQGSWFTPQTVCITPTTGNNVQRDTDGMLKSKFQFDQEG